MAFMARCQHYTVRGPSSPNHTGAFPTDMYDPRRRMHWGSQGFTLIELIMAVAILGILAGMGVPALRETTLNQRVKTATFDLYSSLIYARGEAIKRNGNVDIIPAAGGWVEGWTIQTGGTALKTQMPFTGTTFTGPAGAITFRRNGRLAAAAATLTIKASDSTSITMRCVNIALDGRPNIALDHNGNGICNDG